ncbi:m7GpppX diphosphatase isoform X2 [Cephus cinctus]|uniref:m7GpppX diphosphatase n=1 Tax=Cephus cinctus TaxID=211228 RepID=A0AAJ7RLZ1_CEPCN|nr:m7GpppX diphosphatase isoform X2 [Cephus cinctus]
MAEVRCNDTEDDGPSERKKIKLAEEKNLKCTKSVHETLENLNDFEIKRILKNNNAKKYVCIEGSFKGRNSPAVVTLEKKEFSADDLETGAFMKSVSLRKLHRNDIYGQYECFPNIEYSGLKATIIHPATPKHIKKFEEHKFYLVDETPEDYYNITLPYFEKQSFSLQWIDNIFEHKAEQNRVLYEDQDEEKGFVMVLDLKSTGQRDSLHVLALSRKKIRSLRDLNESHLPLLRNIRDVCREVISIFTERAHMLTTVINNIELMPDYYAKATIPFAIHRDNPLLLKYKEAGVITEGVIDDVD